MKNYLVIALLIGLIFISGCSGCSKSAQKQLMQNKSGEQPPADHRPETVSPGGKTTIKMEKVNGVYEIPTEIDGVPMHFIFDTGAGVISISNVEATFLYKQGNLTQDDIVGKADFTDAEGNVTQGTIIVLKTVKIGDRVLENVEASVVNNLNAPLLMGQSALEKFGKISIDYSNGEITFQ